MIREYGEVDLEAVLEIWLSASVQAHGFVRSGFWESQLGNMRDIYIPASETCVYELDGKVVGFYSLHGNDLAAIFVAPELQGQGIGKQLLGHARSQRSMLRLSVHKENQSSYEFYLSQGSHVVSEQIDEYTGRPAYVMSSSA